MPLFVLDAKLKKRFFMRNFQVITDQEKLREKSRDIWGTGGTLLRLLKKTLSQHPQGGGIVGNLDRCT